MPISPAKIQKFIGINDNVVATNAALRRSPHALSDAAVARLARHAAANGGLTCVSYCDGKATPLGFLLGDGLFL